MVKVLVADDSAVVRVTLARRLRAAGVEVVEAASAKEASAVDAAPLRCALLDLDLGDGNGVDVATALRRSTPSLPIAFFTSEGEGELVTRARAIGRVFAKPGELDGAIAWVTNGA